MLMSSLSRQVLSVASTVQGSSGRWALWVLYGAIQQVTAVTANAMLWGGQDGTAVTQLLGNALLVLPEARPEDRCATWRAQLGDRCPSPSKSYASFHFFSFRLRNLDLNLCSLLWHSNSNESIPQSSPVELL